MRKKKGCNCLYPLTSHLKCQQTGGTKRSGSSFTFILLISCESHLVFRGFSFPFHINMRGGRCNGDWDADLGFTSNCIEREHFVDQHLIDFIKNALQSLKRKEIIKWGRERTLETRRGEFHCNMILDCLEQWSINYLIENHCIHVVFNLFYFYRLLISNIKAL